MNDASLAEHGLEPRQFGTRVLGCGRDIGHGDAAGWPGSTGTPAQLESPACGTGQELSSSEGVPVGGLLPEQHFPTVRYGGCRRHQKSGSISSRIRTDKTGHWNDYRPSCSATTQPAQPSTTSPQPLRGVGVLQPRGQACRDAACLRPPRRTTTMRRVMTVLESRSGFKSCLSQAGREGTHRAASTVASAGSSSPQPTFPWWPPRCGCPRRMGDAWSLSLSPWLPRITRESFARGALLPAEDTGHPRTCPHRTSKRFLLQTPGLRSFLPAGLAGAQPLPGHC